MCIRDSLIKCAAQAFILTLDAGDIVQNSDQIGCVLYLYPGLLPDDAVKHAFRDVDPELCFACAERHLVDIRAADVLVFAQGLA